jgi:hypothetical protein
MSRVRRTAWISVLALMPVSAAAGAAAGGFARVSVSVAPHRSSGDVHISFQPRGGLPHGGFYYAVLVLHEYAGNGVATTPGCAASSDMAKAEYGFPRRGQRLHLTILQARSAEARWCAGGEYLGAVYAVPHRPRCSNSSPCYGSSTQVGPCWILEEGRRVCGVVVKPPRYYSYPGGLPKPIDAASRIVGRFQVRF